MKYNEKTKELFTDDGLLLKKMNCPENIDWKKMEKGKNDLERKCSICEKSVLDTSFLSDSEILHVMTMDKSICLKINVSSNKLK
jgi:hypothetical protein